MDCSTEVEELLEAGTPLIAAGLPIIPCDGKAPIGNDWQNIEVSVKRLESGLAYADDPAIGLIMGPKSDIIDIETDDDGEVAAVRHLFDGCEPVVTVAYTSRRGRHDWFRYDARLEEIGKAVFTYAAPDGNSVKIRLGVNDGGAQSVIPPSANKVWLPGLSYDDCSVAPLPEVVIERMLECHRKTNATPKGNKSILGSSDGPALEAMLVSTKNMEDGEDGSKRLYVASCRAVELNLDDAEALATIRAYEAEKPFPRVWTDAEVLQRVRDAEQRVERGCEVVVANYDEIEIQVDASLLEGSTPQLETKIVQVPRSMKEIIAEIDKHTGGWPRAVDNVLFVDDDKHGIGWFDRRTTQGLFGWLQRRHKCDWKSGGKFVSEGQLFAELERTSQSYEAIELLPHEPPISTIYYRGKPPKPGDGKHLKWLLNRFCPATSIDGDLIKAAMMTCLWGGPAGRRPAFVLTSDYGRGAGKSTLAELIARLFGGAIDVSAGEDIEKLKTRLLSPVAMTKRIAFLDNVKTLKLSWAELESLITAPAISGRRMYVGEGVRPNLLTWFITLNGVSLATDMAQRSVIIKLDKAVCSGDWYDDTAAYIDEHRGEIIGDLIAALRGESFPVERHTRWGTWERDVLCRLPEPSEAQLVIAERQAAANCELDEAAILEEFFAEQLERLGCNPDTLQIRIPVAVVARWYGWATNEQIKTASVTKRIKQMADEGTIKRLSPDSSRTYGRCFVWTGRNADVVGEVILNDLLDRLSKHGKENQ